jgi:hypothetical protein
MVTFLIAIGTIIVAMAAWSLYCHLRGWCWCNWEIFGFGLVIFLNTDFRWTKDLGFSVPYWFYRWFKMKMTIVKICTLWEVPEKDLPPDYKDQILAYRKSQGKAVL